MDLYVDLDRELAARYGVPLNQPAEVVSLTFCGRRLQRFRTPEGEREMQRARLRDRVPAAQPAGLDCCGR